MTIRQAFVKDIQQMQLIRNAVKENRLSDPNLVTDKDCEEYITNRGKGWVCDIEGVIVGFSIVDIIDKNVWALFVDPAYDRRGVGRQLHDTLLDWYFSQTKNAIWLSTAPGTRAAGFYRRAGWMETGTYKKGEIKFEMTFDNWMNCRETIPG